MNENDRIPVEELSEHPFIAEGLKDSPLNELNIESFTDEMNSTNKHYSGFSNVGSSAMTTRFDETVIQDTDVILTTKGSEQVRILLSQLINSTKFTNAQFDMGNSTYFNKHYDGKDTTIRMNDSQVTNMVRLAESQSSNGNESYMYRVASNDVSDIVSMAHKSGLSSLVGGERRTTDLRR